VTYDLAISDRCGVGGHCSVVRREGTFVKEWVKWRAELARSFLLESADVGAGSCGGSVLLREDQAAAIMCNVR
jgi:hypothetical protein